MNRGCRGSAQGVHPTASRIRGGFQASMLPESSHSTERTSSITHGTTSQSSSCGGNQMIVIGTTSPVVNNQQRGDGAEVDGGDISATVTSILSLSRGFRDQMTRNEQRLVGVEKKQEKLSDTLKEISDLVKTLKKDSFSIKGSNYEVCNFFTILCVLRLTVSPRFPGIIKI